ncbi:MAG: acyl-CoA dehydrogenase family protein [Cyclobacteriaceae bacterium]|nr:acyl-CoA dehydrogenase family protein [Cyclobacteriaceae bacterium]
MDLLSMQADKNAPKLIKRNFLGEEINLIEFHPAYEKLLNHAVDSKMFAIKWEDDLRARFAGEIHKLGFASGFLYAQAEMVIYCPLCMTDGAARLIDGYCEEEDRGRLIPRIATLNPDELFTGAMFLTEKSVGSDVGANLVTASHEKDKNYRLNGEKRFCSNANIIFVLARTAEVPQGTKGLSLFLVEKSLPDGSSNYKNIVRLKDKLGVRSMASAEIILTDTIGKRVGEKGEGFK